MTPKRFTWHLTEDSDGDACWTCEREDHGLRVWFVPPDRRPKTRAPGSWNAAADISVGGDGWGSYGWQSRQEAMGAAEKWSRKREREVEVA